MVSVDSVAVKIHNSLSIIYVRVDPKVHVFAKAGH